MLHHFSLTVGGNHAITAAVCPPNRARIRASKFSKGFEPETPISRNAESDRKRYLEVEWALGWWAQAELGSEVQTSTFLSRLPVRVSASRFWEVCFCSKEGGPAFEQNVLNSRTVATTPAACRRPVRKPKFKSMSHWLFVLSFPNWGQIDMFVHRRSSNDFTYNLILRPGFEVTSVRVAPPRGTFVRMFYRLSYRNRNLHLIEIKQP